MGNTVAILLLLSHGEVFDYDMARPIRSAAIREVNLWLAGKGYSELEVPFEADPVRRPFGTAIFFKNLDRNEAADFVEQVRAQPWRHPESLQVLVKEGGAQRFRAA